MKKFSEEDINRAKERFAELIEGEAARITAMEEADEPLDFDGLDKIVVGIMPGDGIGPILMPQALRVMNELVGDEIESGKIELREIEGMTIENRTEKMQSLPDECLEEIKKCHVLLKGPMATPSAGDGRPNLISANSMLRRSLDLYAAVRTVNIKDKNLAFTFFRENIEGEYIWGDKGIQVDDDLAIDFKVQTRDESRRIARAAFEYARKNGKKNVTVVTKANIVKLVDGNFQLAVHEVAKDYPDIEVQDKLVDATAAKVGDPEFMKGVDVVVLPNLYGDIVTDVAAELQGGLGTASSSNIGDRYSLFEAIHGVGPYFFKIGKPHNANPCSLIRAMGQMLVHMGYGSQNEILEKALDITNGPDAEMTVGINDGDVTCEEFTDYIIDTIRELKNS